MAVDPDLKIREELLSLHALNPFINTSSSPRCLMMSGHLSQIITIENGEPQLIQTGLETQLAENTFSKLAETDIRVISILKRYNGISANSVQGVAEYLIIAQNLDTNELDVIDIPVYHKLTQDFGFKYVINENTLNPSIINQIVPKGTVFADSPTVTKDKEYAFGVPTNIAYLSIPEVTGDGVVISESLADKFAYRTYETIVVEFGEDCFPLNLYGDHEEYKPFPDIGEYVKDDRVIMATRRYDTLMSPALVSKKDVRDYNVYFDKPYYSASLGGKVVDIKVYHNAKARKSTYTNTVDQVNRYAEALKQHYKDLINVYETQNRKYYAQYKRDIPVSEKLQRMLIKAYAIVNEENNIRFTHKNDIVDLYRIEFTIEHYKKPNIEGYKLTTLSGSKGVIVKVMKDEDMPVDEFGNRAEMVMDPTSIPGRMNPSNLYEQEFSAISRKIKKLVMSEIDKLGGLDSLDDTSVNQVFEIVLGGLKYFGTEQYEYYLNTSIEERKEILREIYEKEMYIYYKVSSDRKPYEIIKSIEGTIYYPERSRVLIKTEDNPQGVWTENKILIAPQYIILLAKTPEEYLATASAKTNHYDFPISVGPKIRQNLPYRNSPVKILSETETRLYASYVGEEGLAELKDRANSIETHRMLYNNILMSQHPTYISELINRKEHPFGTDKAIEIVESILHASGLELIYVPENKKQ